MNGAGTRRILLSETRPTPWKNGGGVTREIAVGAAPGSDLGWGWRFSIAEVERDGPFSIFVGVDRIISVIAGEGMDLRHADGSLTPLEPFQPVRISGEELLFGRLRRGPVQDLNIMILRDRFEATLEIWRGPCAGTVTTGAQACLLLHALDGSCTARLPGGVRHDLAESETLVQEAAAVCEIRLSAGMRAAVVCVKSRPRETGG